MMDYISRFVQSENIFWFCAIAGSGMFLIQFMMNIFSLGGHDGIDTSDISSDTTIHSGGRHTADFRKFKWLSMQTITGFLMMFGWTAITCQYEFELQESVTMGIALASGLFVALLIRSIFKVAKKLTSPGNIHSLEEAIGKEGYVYQTIPKGGRGKVSLSLQNFTHEIDAISHHADELPSFMRVKIIEKSDERTVVVTPL